MLSDRKAKDAHINRYLICVALSLLASMAINAEQSNVLVEDFEGNDYGDWEVSSGWSVDAFSVPMRAPEAEAVGITGYQGSGLASTRNYDNELDAPWATRVHGEMVSPEFTVERDFINFLIGGGEYHWRVSVNLLDGEKSIRTTTGPGGKNLVWRSWDVSRLKGKTVRIRILDCCFDADAFILVDRIEQSDTAKGIIGGDTEYAWRMVRAEVARNQRETFESDTSDPTRYNFHYTPPGQMTDPHGAMFHNGYYHLFYQNHAFAGRRGNNKHWGHARSRDFVRWELLPTAIFPSYDLGEGNCFSGSSFINSKGQWMIFYTMVPLIGPREQWMALAQDDDLIEWTKSDANPMLALDEHDGPEFSAAWRDPWVFSSEGRTFMILTADVSVPIYEALNEDLTRWTYRGIFYQREGLAAECPSFIRLGGKWLLMYSFYEKGIPYVIGEFDSEKAVFHRRQEGFLNHNDAMYATYPMFDQQGRCILYGNLIESKSNYRGVWRQGLTLARSLALGSDGLPRQAPLEEFQRLRGDHQQLGPFELNDSPCVLENVRGDSYEMIVEIEPGTATACGVRVHRSDDGQTSSPICFDGKTLDVGGVDCPFSLLEHEKTLKLHVFVDKGALDVFVNDGRVAETRLMFPEEKDQGVEVFAEGGTATVKSINVWEMKFIW